MPKSIPVVRVGLLDNETGEFSHFHLTFFGLSQRDFMMVPGGSTPIHEALKEQGLGENYTSSPFLIG